MTNTTSLTTYIAMAKGYQSMAQINQEWANLWSQIREEEMYSEKMDSKETEKVS